MKGMSTIRRDFVAINLRSQLNRLRDILHNIEVSNGVDFEYADLSLKEIELGVRKIRKVCGNTN